MNLKKNLFIFIIISAIFIFFGHNLEHTTTTSENYALSFEEYLEDNLNQISEKNVKILKPLYEEIIQNEQAENYEQADKLWINFNNILRTNDINVPYKNFIDFIETEKDILGDKNYKLANTIYEKINTFDDSTANNENLEKEFDKLENMLTPLGYDLNEILEDIEDKSVFIAFYNVNKGDIIYKPMNNHTLAELSQEDINKHQLIWQRVKKIIPENYLKKITTYKINTDGKDNIMAHVNSPDQSNKIWKLTVDIKDAFTQNGEISKEFDNTLIHEFAHILTLNNSQMLEKRNENSSTYTTDEGTTKKDSYLNKFYNAFWADVYNEWKKAKESVDDELEENPALLEFYEKHENDFVSEYATTNIEEDIAESFMHFVINDKPQDATIANKKILYFYQFKELIEIRKEIRSNLNM